MRLIDYRHRLLGPQPLDALAKGGPERIHIVHCQRTADNLRPIQRSSAIQDDGHIHLRSQVCLGTRTLVLKEARVRRPGPSRNGLGEEVITLGCGREVCGWVDSGVRGALKAPAVRENLNRSKRACGKLVETTHRINALTRLFARRVWCVYRSRSVSTFIGVSIQHYHNVPGVYFAHSSTRDHIHANFSLN